MELPLSWSCALLRRRCAAAPGRVGAVIAAMGAAEPRWLLMQVQHSVLQMWSGLVPSPCSCEAVSISLRCEGPPGGALWAQGRRQRSRELGKDSSGSCSLCAWCTPRAALGLLRSTLLRAVCKVLSLRPMAVTTSAWVWQVCLLKPRGVKL